MNTTGYNNIATKENRYKELLERLNVIAYEFDLAKYCFTYVNKQAESILGYSCDEWYIKGFWYNHLHPDDRKTASEYSRVNTRLNKDHEFEYRMIAADGTVKWFKDITSVISDDGVPRMLQGVIVDITERKISEQKLIDTELRLSTLLENLQNVVFYESSTDGTYITENIKDMLGYTSKEFSENEGLFFSIIHPDDVQPVRNKFETWRKPEKNSYSKIELRLRRKDGTYIWIEDRMYSVVTTDRSYWAGYFFDITERKQTEEKLKETSLRLSAIIDNLANLTIYETGAGRNYVSENIESLTGIPLNDFLKDKLLFGTLIHADDREALNKKIKAWHKRGAKGVLSNEFRILNSRGEHIWIEDHMFKMKDENGEEYLSGIMLDITEKKKTLEKISDTELRLSTVLNNLPNIVIYQSGNGKDFISENISEMIGYTPEEILKEKHFFKNIMHPLDLSFVKKLFNEWETVAKQKTILNLEYRLRNKYGEYIWVEDHMFKVNPSSSDLYYSGILIDITERKNTEKKITESLKEKEVLLKEIHHRVKNNLQIVSSLLKLQSNSVNDVSALNILLESQNRVQSMALVHQKLYQSKDFAKVDFTDYVKKLSANLMDVYKMENKHINLNLKSDEIFIGVDVAIPCGLIINELLSNSLKYAFQNREKGSIYLCLSCIGKGNYKMNIKDDGVGFPKNINYKKTKSLGLQLVNTLVRQIDASIELKNSTGTEFVITFFDPSQTFLKE